MRLEIISDSQTIAVAPEATVRPLVLQKLKLSFVQYFPLLVVFSGFLQITSPKDPKVLNI
jgi:hypothetical protein